MKDAFGGAWDPRGPEPRRSRVGEGASLGGARGPRPGAAAVRLLSIARGRAFAGEAGGAQVSEPEGEVWSRRADSNRRPADYEEAQTLNSGA